MKKTRQSTDGETDRYFSLKLRIFVDQDIAIGPGKAELLEAIQQHGSIAAAARAMGMSYRRAWQLVETMNNCFVSPLVLSLKGGSGGGGAQVTPLGKEVLSAYRALEKKASASLRKDLGLWKKFLRENTVISEKVSDVTLQDAHK